MNNAGAQVLQLLQQARASRQGTSTADVRPANNVPAVQAPTLGLDQVGARNLQLLTRDNAIYEAPRARLTTTDESASEYDNPNYAQETKAFEEASKAAGRRYQEFVSTGNRQGREVVWEERGGQLVQVGSRDVSWNSSWNDFRDNIARPAAAIAASAIGGPAIASALGGGMLGAVGAGAAISGATTALNGGNSSQILRNAVIGGASAGAVRGLTPVIGNVGARAVTGGLTAAARGGNVVEGAVMGGINAANPNAARALNIIRTIQRQQSATSAQPRPRR